MKSHLDEDFIRCFYGLPDRIKQKARKNYNLWKKNPAHPRLDFKKVHPTDPIYSVRIGIGWRALGVKNGNLIVWFWIGSHSGYDKIIHQI